MINVPENTAAHEDELSPMKTDLLTLVDITADFSNREVLATKEMLFEAFSEKAPKAAAPKVSAIQAEIDRSVDEALKLREKDGGAPVKVPVGGLGRESGAVMPPSTRDQRKILTRREMLSSLLSGHIGEALAAAEAEEKAQEGEPRVISPEYFDQVLAAGLEGEFGLASLTAWDGTVYYHYKPLLSQMYARMLSAKNNPLELVKDTVRENSRIYPRPVNIETFGDMPFSLSPEELEELMKRIAEDEDGQDIRYTTTSIGSVYLYSRKYLDDDYADFLAEQIDVGMDESP